MRVGIPLVVLLSVSLLAGCLGSTDPPESPEPVADHRVDDVVVVAVLDWQMNPYHWDFLAEHMPQHQDGDPATDLPLSEDPSTWLPGFPDPADFASYDALNLTLTPDDPDADANDLYEQDSAEWAKMERTTRDEVHYRYVPGTKMVGFITTSGSGDGFAASSHGVGASSVSVGNIHGSCPSCLLVFVDIPGAAGLEWVRQQDWIDVTSHSYEGSTVGGNVRDSLVDCDTSLEQEAAERGQQIFWAAGNGLANTFTAPQTTLASCQKAPEWSITVGAIHPGTQASYTGHAKPVHVSSIGQGYPSAGGPTVTSESMFSGTSNATPVVAGLYAEALYRLRAETQEATRMQQDGVVMAGGACGDADPDCPLAEGRLTAHGLREALFRAAEHTDAYFHSSILLDDPIPLVGTQETEYWTEGHGSFLGRLGDWEGEVQRIVDHARGAVVDERGGDLHDWMTAYSWCVQQAWGEWDHGYWKSGDPLPDPDPGWPQRTWMASEACPATIEALIEAHHAANMVQDELP